jgi:threonine dehydratase
MTFEINRSLLRAGLSVTDDEAGAAMRFAFSNLKLVVEPGGAVALAAVLAQKVELRGKTTAVVLSGGNVDRALFSRIMQAAD